MLVTNETRRRAILYGFLPLLALAAVLSLRIHVLVPSLTTWPTQREIAGGLATIARHKFWPWSVDGYDQGELEKEIESVTKVEAHGAPKGKGEDSEAHEATPGRVSFSRHIVAVGDLHGDLPNARKVLRFAGVTDEKGDWSGDVDFFVQTGDIIDRGDDTIVLFLWMEKLRAQATRAGGTVLSLLGNHEWMNALGDWRYVYPSELKTFGTIDARQRMLTTGRIGRAWATNYTTAARLPLHPSLGPPNTPYPHSSIHFQKDDETLDLDMFTHHDATAAAAEAAEGPMAHAALSFVHGGLAPSYPELTPFPTRINDIAASLLSKLQNRPQPPPHPPAPYAGMPKDATTEETRLYNTNGPLWFRGWAQGDDETVCAQVDAVLARTGTRRMIMGHTPDFHNIKSRCNGKIIIIDTGISHAYGGVLSALSIKYTLTPIGGLPSLRWKEKEVVSAIYADRREVIATNEREVVGDFEHTHWQVPQNTPSPA